MSPVVEAVEGSFLDDRVLVLAATSKDAALTKALLGSAGIISEACATLADLLERMLKGAAAILLPEEALTPGNNEKLRATLGRQPPWSDLPILVLTRSGAHSAEARAATRELGNVTLLERPMHGATLVSTVHTAVRARQRQYQIRGYIEDRAKAEKALRLADQRKDEFLAMLGHELRNPLAPLVTASQLLKLANLRDPVTARVSEVMERQVGHLIRLVEDLLEVSRITRGVIDIRSEPVDLGSVVRAAVETTRPLVDAAQHYLKVEVPPEPVLVAGDDMRLTQVFTNLITNAAKYTKQGGKITVTVGRRAERALVSVRDNGIGIPESYLDSVFDMFTQVNRSERRTQGGLGIGLTLVRSLVSMHGGRVVARSGGLDAGSEFTVDLPVMTDGLPGTTEQDRPIQFPSCRILVVDDNRDAAESLGALLSVLGATVSVVHDGASAIAGLDAFDPDVILLDIGMPRMDGYEVSRRIRATPGHAGILLIALTGWGQEQDRQRSREAGFDHHLVKPPDIRRLHELVAAAPLARLRSSRGST